MNEFGFNSTIASIVCCVVTDKFGLTLPAIDHKVSVSETIIESKPRAKPCAVTEEWKLLTTCCSIPSKDGSFKKSWQPMQVPRPILCKGVAQTYPKR